MFFKLCPVFPNTYQFNRFRLRNQFGFTYNSLPGGYNSLNKTVRILISTKKPMDRLLSQHIHRNVSFRFRIFFHILPEQAEKPRKR